MADDLTPSELLTAACSGDIQKVMKLLPVTNTEQSENDNRARLNVRNNEGETALHLAIHQDNVTGIQTLLRAGAEINLRNEKEETALMVAIKQGKSSCARQLIDLGANINCVDKEGRNALMLAAAKGEEECLQILIEAGADLNLQSKRKYDGMLEHKLSNELCASVNLFSTKKDLYVQSKREYTGNDYCGPTALMSAAGNVQVSCLKLLLQAGADANVKTSNGETALMWVAEMAGSPSISTSAVEESVRILVNSGAVINARNADGQTALNLTVKEAIRELFGSINMPAVTECVKILIDSNADVTINGYEGETALSYAARSDLLVDLLPILTEAGAVVDHQNSIGMTALAYAVQSGNRTCKCVRWLVDSGASINIRDHSGKTPLHYLFYESAHDDVAEQCLQIILTKMPDLNAADSDGETPLMNAAKHAVGTNTIGMLLQHGADLNLCDNLGQTALIHSLATEHLWLDLEEDEPFLTCGNSALFNVLFLLVNGAKFNIGQLGTGCPSMLAAFTYDLDLVNLKIGKEVNLQASPYSFSSVIHKDHKRILQFFIINGMMPSQPRMEYTFCYANDTDTIYRASSVLDAAAKSGRLGITKYLVAICYLCSSDLTLFKAGSPYWSVVSKNQDISTVMKNLHSQPWPLVKLCFMAVSTAFGASPGRQERVKNSQLPLELQRMLLFQEPWFRLCVHQWDKIPLTFSPEIYEKLPRPRPLLYYWPVGRELIPCDCGKCDGTVFKYEHNEQEK